MCCFLFSVSVSISISVFSLTLTSPQEGIHHKKNLLRFGTLLFFVYFVLFVVFKDVGKDKFFKGGPRGITSSLLCSELWLARNDCEKITFLDSSRVRFCILF